MDTATLNYLSTIANELQQAKHGHKQPIIDKACAFLTCSTQTFYRLLEDAGLKPKPKSGKRKQRADKGNTQITRQQAELLGGMILVAMRANGKRILSVKDAAEILQAQGKLPNVCTTTILRALKMYHCHPDQLATPTAHTRQRSLYPNHVWQLDPSVCVLFYLPKGGLAVMEEKHFYKNKPKNVAKVAKQRVMRYVISDHYSSTIYVEYVMGAESSENLTQVFLNAIQKRGHNDPIHGVPDILVLDKGSANLSGLFLNLLERLDVRAIPHATGNSRAKGQVEKSNDIVECKFESRLAFLKVQSLDELNTYANKWRLHFNATAKHTRTKKTRNAVWQTITAEQLRIAPPLNICRELVTTKPKPFKVTGDLTVSHTVKGYPNQNYDISHLPNIYVKADVQIVVNPYRLPSIDVHWFDEQDNPAVYTVEPIITDGNGFDINAPVIGEKIVAKPDSQADTNRKRMLKQAYGADTEAEVDKARKQRKPAFEGQVDPMADINAADVPLYMPKNGQAVDVGQIKTPQLKALTHVQAAKELRGIVGDLWGANLYAQLVEQYPQGVPPQAIDDIANRIKNDNSVTYMQLIDHKKAVNH